MRRLKLAFAVLVTLALLPVGATADAAGIQTWTGTVIRILDGDTFDVRLTNGTVQTIRVAGINTNETKRDPKCWADEATDRLAELIDGKTVKLRARSASSKAQGRPFRHVFLGKTNIAQKMLREGYGIPFVLTQEDDYIDDYVAAFYKAFDAGRRIHDSDACGAGPDANFDLLVNGNADGPDAENLNGEYVRIRNNGATTLSMAGWLMHDSATDYYNFPASASIPPGGVLTVHAGSGNDSATHLYMGFTKQVYSNIDGAFLMDPDGDLRAFQSWPCDGICGSGAVPRVVIDEVQYDGPGNDSENPNVEWVRIRNAGTHAVDLRDWSFVSNPYVVYSETSRVLQPGETLTLFVGEGTNTSNEIYWGKNKSILNNEGDSIALVTPTGDVAACRAWGGDSCVLTRANGFERASTDFDADGFDDLAVGVPGEDFGTKRNAGSVVVIPGKATGVARSGGKTWKRGKIAGKASRGDRFGSAVSAGDFNGDGYDDLAAGAAQKNIGTKADAGTVNVIYGSRRGLRRGGNEALSQKGLIAGVPQANDRFGEALASGDFDGDGYDDLAVGVPGEDVGAAGSAGSVNIIYGSASGLTTSRNRSFEQVDGNVSGVEASDRYGAALTSADFNGDGYDDLAVGAPGESINGISGAGQVNILYGSGAGLTTNGNAAFSQLGGISGDPEAGDRFAASLAAGDLNADGYADLVVGVSGEDIAGKSNAGQLNVIYGSATGLRATANAAFSQAGDVAGNPGARDAFADAVAVGDFDGDGFADIIASAHGEDRGGVKNSGTFHVLFGSVNGVGVARNALFDQRNAGGALESGNKFGSSLTVLDIDGDGRVDVVAGSVGDDLSGRSNAGSVGVVFGRAPSHAARSGLKISQDGAVPGVSEAGDLFGGAL